MRPWRSPLPARHAPVAASYEYEGGAVNVDLGVARGVDAQSFGQPGQRTFRLRVLGSASESASLWVEKEHLRALSLALRQLLPQLGYEQQPQAADVGEFPDVAEHDFRVGRMGIGFNPSQGTVVLQVDELEREEDFTLRVQLTLPHCASLVVQAEAITAAGRPICPLCGLPMDPSGHTCSRSNGHSKQPISDTDST